MHWNEEKRQGTDIATAEKNDTTCILIINNIMYRSKMKIQIFSTENVFVSIIIASNKYNCGHEAKVEYGSETNNISC